MGGSDKIAEREEYFISRVRFREWCFSQLQTEELTISLISLYSSETDVTDMI